MRIAITGGSGTIGQAVIALGAERRHTFVNIDVREPAPGSAAAGQPFVRASTTDYDAVRVALRGCDALVHLAAIGHAPHTDHEVLTQNVSGTCNTLNAAVSQGIVHICQASSVNVIGHTFGRAPRYDYFPLDEQHPSYAEDSYSLSKWLMEREADAVARQHPDVSIASLRFHGCWAHLEEARAHCRAMSRNQLRRWLGGYTALRAAARACLQSLEASFTGHEAMFVVAPNTLSSRDSRDLACEFFPAVPIRGEFEGNASFFDSGKAERLLGWRHDTD